VIRKSLRKCSFIFGDHRVSLYVSSLTADHYFWCSRVFLALLRVFRGIMGCSRVFRGVPGVFWGVPRVFRVCSGVFRVLQTPVTHGSKCKAYVEQICMVDSCNLNLRNVTQLLKHLEPTERLTTTHM